MLPRALGRGRGGEGMMVFVPLPFYISGEKRSCLSKEGRESDFETSENTWGARMSQGRAKKGEKTDTSLVLTKKLVFKYLFAIQGLF